MANQELKMIDLNQDDAKAINKIHNPIDRGEGDIMIERDRAINIELDIIRSIINKMFK